MRGVPPHFRIPSLGRHLQPPHPLRQCHLQKQKFLHTIQLHTNLALPAHQGSRFPLKIELDSQLPIPLSIECELHGSMVQKVLSGDILILNGVIK